MSGDYGLGLLQGLRAQNDYNRQQASDATARKRKRAVENRQFALRSRQLGLSERQGARDQQRLSDDEAARTFNQGIQKRELALREAQNNQAIASDKLKAQTYQSELGAAADKRKRAAEQRRARMGYEALKLIEAGTAPGDVEQRISAEYGAHKTDYAALSFDPNTKMLSYAGDGHGNAGFRGKIDALSNHFARLAGIADEKPVKLGTGDVLVKNGQVVARNPNQRQSSAKITYDGQGRAFQVLPNGTTRPIKLPNGQQLSQSAVDQAGKLYARLYPPLAGEHPDFSTWLTREYPRILKQASGRNTSNSGAGLSTLSGARSAQTQTNQPARISSQADFDRLPSGALFINPSDNRVMRKN